MTILDALKSKIKYPMTVDFFLSILIDRGLNGDEEYTTSVATSKEFKGARADSLIELIDTPNISEGSVSISVADKASIIVVANRLYRELGEPLYEKPQPKVTAYYE